MSGSIEEVGEAAAEVLATAATSAPETRRYGWVRANMEAFGMAILMAVLLKYFVIEAYVIPTPSMQPTMMGSPESGLRDRILVDKIHYELFEPKRWDVAVFRYPLRQIQSYVKRIVGVGPEQLRIAGGNLYTRKQATDPWQIARKPDRIQRRIWKEIFPLRFQMAVGIDREVIPNYFSWRFVKWYQKGNDVLFADIKAGRRAELSFKDVRHNGFANHIYDGYDVDVARIIRDASAPPSDDKDNDNGKWGVSDLRMSYDVEPTETPEKVTLEIEVTLARLAFRLVIADSKARLQVVKTKKARIPEQVLTSSEEFAFELPAGESTPIAFAHVDDELIVWRDGDIVQRFGCDKHRILDDLKPHQVRARLAVAGGGRVTLTNVKIERDLHYTRSGTDIAQDEIIEVPAGHFFMMGDNTLGSADSRAWKSITIGIDEDNNIVDPERHKSARVIRGNKRPRGLQMSDQEITDRVPVSLSSAWPAADDNPFPCMKDGKDWVAFGDHLGQMYALKAKVPKYWGLRPRNDSGSADGIDNSAEFISNRNGAFVPKEASERFVPREHIQGRPLVTFFRSFDTIFFDRWIR
ncbi:MAG: signal peptidase I [Planctomycetota bacterium]|jgi:signal peptidase I